MKKNISNSIGESWVISGVPVHISVVSNGALKGPSLTDLIVRYKEDLIVRKVYERFGNEFPLLIKFIDTKTNLSIQLHPDDKLAREGMIPLAKQRCCIFCRQIKELNRDLTKQEYLDYLENGNINEILHMEEVEKGDSIFI